MPVGTNLFDGMATPTGLGGSGEFAKKVTQAQATKPLMDRLRPGTDLHEKVLRYLNDRIEHSEREMKRFHPRWNYNEKRLQAFIDLSTYEQALKDLNDQGAPASAISMVIPYSFATIQTIQTYLMHTYAGRKPLFQIGAYNNADVGNERSMAMEQWLQFNSDHTRFLRELYQFIHDGEVYGVQILRTDWEIKQRMTTVWLNEPQTGFLGTSLPNKQQKTRQRRTVYAGNKAAAIDPYLFFPDPRVPMHRVAEEGEWVFWRSFEGKHKLLGLEAEGKVRWIERVPAMPQRLSGESTESASQRALRADGEGIAGDAATKNIAYVGADPIQIDQGTVEIIPAELGLSNSRTPQKYMFAVANGQVIIQASPYERDHGLHPVVVGEPYTQGYSFGSLGMSDYLGPLQDTISWYINSHIHNVRTAINNMLVVDPSKVQMSDVKRPGPGRTIRLKSSAFGTDVRLAIQQLPVTDVTANHVRDLDTFVRFADGIASVNDNIRGIQSSGGRKTATEVRTSGEAAASRLADHARRISSQSMVPLANMWAVNTQQHLDRELFFTVVGMDATKVPTSIRPEHVSGDFYFPVHDGTLPIDRVAMLDIWREIFLGMLQSPELSQRYDISGVFGYIAELGGAHDIKRFRLDLRQEELLAREAEAGNVVSLDEARSLPGSQLNTDRTGTGSPGTEAAQLRGG